LPPLFLQFAREKHWKIDPATIDPGEMNWDAYDAVAELPQQAG